MEINLTKFHNIHFVGIGGIGLSAIAQLMVIKGKTVTGSDTSSSIITEKLSASGVKIYYGHKKSNLSGDVDLVIHTIAISADNPELTSAREKRLLILTYPQILGIVSSNMKTIAVSGTHGKTTTTAMIAKILMDAGLDPTVIVGSLMKDSESNLVVGNSDYFLVEACEYRRSFLNLNPKVLLITNIEADHLDYYKDLDDVQSAFTEMISKLPNDGVIICNPNYESVKRALKTFTGTILDYTKQKNNFTLKVPGEHNIQNAKSALCLAELLDLDNKKSVKSLSEFSGTWRRFDFKGKTANGSLIYDDYAHHPTEVKAALSGARDRYPKHKLIVFFQPHQFSRTKILMDEFAKSFETADQVYILPIYGARENFDAAVNSKQLAEKIGQKAEIVENFDACLEQTSKFDESTVILFMGAGDINKLSEMCLSHRI